MDVAETAFKKSVENAVNERLKGGQPPKKGDTNGGQSLDAMSYAEKCEYIEKHPNSPEVLKYLNKNWKKG